MTTLDVGVQKLTCMTQSSPMSQHVCLIAHHSCQVFRAARLTRPLTYYMLFSLNGEEFKPTRLQNATLAQGSLPYKD